MPPPELKATVMGVGKLNKFGNREILVMAITSSQRKQTCGIDEKQRRACLLFLLTVNINMCRLIFWATKLYLRLGLPAGSLVQPLKPTKVYLQKFLAPLDPVLQRLPRWHPHHHPSGRLLKTS